MLLCAPSVPRDSDDPNRALFPVRRALCDRVVRDGARGAAVRGGLLSDALGLAHPRSMTAVPSKSEQNAEKVHQCRSRIVQTLSVPSRVYPSLAACLCVPARRQAGTPDTPWLRWCSRPMVCCCGGLLVSSPRPVNSTDESLKSMITLKYISFFRGNVHDMICGLLSWTP